MFKDTVTWRFRNVIYVFIWHTEGNIWAGRIWDQTRVRSKWSLQHTCNQIWSGKWQWVPAPPFESALMLHSLQHQSVEFITRIRRFLPTIIQQVFFIYIYLSAPPIPCSAEKKTEQRSIPINHQEQPATEWWKDALLMISALRYSTARGGFMALSRQPLVSSISFLD